MKKALGTINGHIVIACALVPNASGFIPNRRIVLVDRLESRESPRYVVASHVDGETSWDLGFYTGDITKALQNFAERYLSKVGA